MEQSEQFPGGAAAGTASASAREAAAQPESPCVERTPGLKAFDILLYPLLTNFGVFAISVAATYLTARGGERNANGKLIYGKMGEWFQSRGEKLKGVFTRTGMTENQADMSKMVAFSFIDGSLMAPVVKVFEDHRKNIGRAIDIRLGTHDPDNPAYKAEPKQSWLSVLGGRLSTVSIVVPTAVALDKTGLNDTLFTRPGKEFGTYLAGKPGIAKWFGKLDIAELGRIGAFEAFYTSVCTAGIYFSSRLIARTKDKHAAAKEAAGDAAPPAVQDEEGSHFRQAVRPKETRIPLPAGSFTQRLDAAPDMGHSRV